MTQVSFEYAVGDHVLVIHAGDIPARVSALKLEYSGRQYRVIWWQDGRRYEDWMLEWEIKKDYRKRETIGIPK